VALVGCSTRRDVSMSFLRTGDAQTGAGQIAAGFRKIFLQQVSRHPLWVENHQPELKQKTRATAFR
jgi:hypothetical protein